MSYTVVATATDATRNAESSTNLTLPDLVIADVVLARTSGIDLAILVKHRFPASRVLLFSGQATTADLLAETASKGHTFEILAKPIRPKQMLALALRLLMNDSPRTSTKAEVA